MDVDRGMALNEGTKPSKEELLKGHWKNLSRLYMWMMAGADVENGLWAVYGARQGLVKLMCTNWDYTQVRDFDFLENLWTGNENMNSDNLYNEIVELGNTIVNELNLPILSSPLTPELSMFTKTILC